MTSRPDINALVAALTPVQPVRPLRGVSAVLAAAALAAGGVFLTYGYRPDILAGEPQPIVVVRAGLLALLGLAASIAAARSASPGVGAAQSGWLWALAAALVLPAAGVFLFGMHMVTGDPFQAGAMDFHYADHCLGISLTSALVVGAALVLWLRRGAPTALGRAGWLVGVAAGSYGTLAYSLHCPSNSIYYVSLFYTLAVAASAILGRVVAPRFLRW